MSFLSRFLGPWRTADRASAVDHRMQTLPVGIGYKWIPVIDSNYCTGCGKCVEACPSEALGLVWDFARLQRPDRCTSEAACVDACPTVIIEMRWSSVEGSRTVGIWRGGLDGITSNQTVESSFARRPLGPTGAR